MLSSEGGMRFCQKMVLVGYGSGRALFNRFAAVGRMALSNYLTHSLIMTSLCYGYGPGLDSGDPRYLQQGLVVALIGLLLLVSPWWLYYFRLGPAERLCRSPTYGQRQPMRRQKCILWLLPAVRQPYSNNQEPGREDVMALADLKNVLNIFGGSDISEDKQNELFKEVLLMTLARAADADINIQAIEVERIQEIIKRHTGEDVSAADVRVAARAELYAEAGLRKYLSKVQSKMKTEHRAETIQALADIFRSDHVVSPLEIDFFDRVAESLGATPAQIAGLVAGDVEES